MRPSLLFKTKCPFLVVVVRNPLFPASPPSPTRCGLRRRRRDVNDMVAGKLHDLELFLNELAVEFQGINLNLNKLKFREKNEFLLPSPF